MRELLQAIGGEEPNPNNRSACGMVPERLGTGKAAQNRNVNVSHHLGVLKSARLVQHEEDALSFTHWPRITSTGTAQARHTESRLVPTGHRENNYRKAQGRPSLSFHFSDCRSPRLCATSHRTRAGSESRQFPSHRELQPAAASREGANQDVRVHRAIEADSQKLPQ